MIKGYDCDHPYLNFIQRDNSSFLIGVRPIRITSYNVCYTKLLRIRVIGEKAADLAANGRRVVKLHVGEPDFETPERIRGAAIASLNRKETHYTHNRGTMELRTAVSRKLSAENGVTADPSSELLISYNFV